MTTVTAAPPHATIDAGDSGGPPRGARGRRAGAVARALAVVVMAALVPVWVSMTAPYRGPGYLWFNMDPQYAYLFNSLAIAEGHSPNHTDHPGTPLQVLGAVTLLAVHALEGGDAPLRDAVLGDPERWLGFIRAAMTGAVALLSLAGGAMALRATGSVVHAAAIQITPILGWRVTLVLDHVQVEPLLIGLAMAFGGAVLLAIHRPPGVRLRRAAVVLGLITATGFSTKILFAPLLLVGLAAFATRGHRLLYLGAGGLFLGLWLAPIASQLPRMLGWLGGIATHTGRYGAGENLVLDPRTYPAQLVQLCAEEPFYPVVALAALAVGAPAALLARGRADARAQRLAACLIAADVAQLALLAVVAKHPAPHYLTAGVGLAGLMLSLSASLLSSLVPPRVGRWAVPALALVVASLFAERWSRMLHWRPYAARSAADEGLVADFLRSPEGVGVLQGAQISTVEAALHFGNIWVRGRYGDDLRRLYPGVLIWDRAGPVAFGRPATAEEAQRLWSRGMLVALVPRFFGPDHFRLSELSIVTVRQIAAERLIHAFPRPVVAAGTPAFDGFTALAGLGAEEPFTHRGEASRVRWGLGPATHLRFRSGGEPLLLVFEARPNNQRGQTIEVLLDGRPLYAHGFASREFELHSLRLHPGPGDHDLTFRYGLPQRVNGRDLSVLFKRLQIVPAN